MFKRSQSNTPQQISRRKFHARAEHCALSERQTVFSYSVALIRRSRPVRLWERYVKYIRRFRVITTAFRLLPWILLLISTHTLLYAVTAVAAILVPLLLLALLSLAASALIRYRDVNRIMERQLAKKTVFVLFPQRGQELSARFWRANVLNLAAGSSACAVIVSPFFLSRRGLRNSPFYFNVREEAPRVFIVRRHYFYSLKKHVFKQHVSRLIFIY